MLWGLVQDTIEMEERYPAWLQTYMEVIWEPIYKTNKLGSAVILVQMDYFETVCGKCGYSWLNDYALVKCLGGGFSVYRWRLCPRCESPYIKPNCDSHGPFVPHGHVQSCVRSGYD